MVRGHVNNHAGTDDDSGVQRHPRAGSNRQLEPVAAGGAAAVDIPASGTAK